MQLNRGYMKIHDFHMKNTCLVHDTVLCFCFKNENRSVKSYHEVGYIISWQHALLDIHVSVVTNNCIMGLRAAQKEGNCACCCKPR